MASRSFRIFLNPFLSFQDFTGQDGAIAQVTDADTYPVLWGVTNHTHAVHRVAVDGHGLT